MRDAGIGVFDSGIGGLTVFKALKETLPAGERLVYLGDTARVPYGTKSDETVTRYALEGALFLERRGIKALVIACNTMSAVALPALQSRLKVPVVGVIGPGAEAACGATRRQVMVAVMFEATFIGLCSALVAVAVGVPCALIFTKVVGIAATGWSVPFRFPTLDAVRTALAIIITASLAGLIPGRRAARMKVVSALSYE